MTTIFVREARQSHSHKFTAQLMVQLHPSSPNTLYAPPVVDAPFPGSPIGQAQQ